MSGEDGAALGLQRWWDFLGEQMALFEAGIRRCTGRSHIATEMNVAFLRIGRPPRQPIHNPKI
jgi:hypothetical protein